MIFPSVDIKPRARSVSRVSDQSYALPDLEGFVPNVENVESKMEEDKVKSKSLVMIPHNETKEQDSNNLKLEERQQLIRDSKAWIQNSLMTVVGVGVLAYLQTLESSM